MNLPRLHSTGVSRYRELPGAPVSDPAREVQAQEPVWKPAFQKHPHARAFTLIEIAIAIGVIGFALVAIMGILPFGLEVQRDNRSETIINQDATFWLEAIRNGAVGIDELPSYVENISLIKRSAPEPDASITYSNRWALLGRGPADNYYQTGDEIVSLLTWAALKQDPAAPLEFREVRAQITAISGSAAEKDLDPSKRDLAFRYILRVVVDPGTNSAVSFAALDPANPPELLDSLHELRLTFFYPFVRDTQLPSRKANYRASLNRNVVTNLVGGQEHYFFRP